MAIYDNSFTRDTNTVRSERLTALAANVASIAAELELPAALITQAEGAANAFNAAEQLTTARAGQSTIAVNNVRNAITPLKNKYIAAKNFLLDLIQDEPLVNDGYAIECGIKDNVAANYEEFRDQINKLLDAQARFAADSVPYLLPTSVLAEIQTLRTEMLTTLSVLASAKTAKLNAKRAERALFTAHTKMLNEIRNRALFTWIKDDPNFYLLGMAPEEFATGGGQPDTPEASYILADQRFRWGAVANATSYEVETSTDSGATTDDINVPSGATEVEILQTGQTILARVRSRNANGVSSWGTWITIPALILAPVSGFGYITNVGFGWTPTAENVEIEASYDGGLTWNPIASGPYPSGLYPWIPPAGMFRIRRVSGGVAGPWTVITVVAP